MTTPRQILRGTTYLVTRRCSRREFLLRPSATTNGIFQYVLAVAARRFGIRVHAFCVLSNHYHLVVTDPEARLPAFGQYLDSLVARAVNATIGRWESFWAPSSYSAVALVSPADIVSKAAYVLANPVAAGLVRRGSAWPGLRSAPEQIGSGAIAAPRPTTFFRAGGGMPEAAHLELVAPDAFESPREFRDRLVEAVSVLEERAHLALASAGRAFLGVARILAQNGARPTRGEPRRKLSPRVASHDTWKRVEALSRLKAFVRAYRDAWSAMRAGVLDVLFPAGTYALRVLHGVRCAAPA